MPEGISGPGVYFSTSGNCAANLAMEEFLLTSVRPGDEILYLYENDTAVVIGRFQNPWRECRTGLAGRQGIGIYRRISGGGTVVHGTGNLNIAMISGTPRPDKEANLDRIIRALSPLGLKIVRNERHDLLLQPGSFKVSGSAFRQTSNCSMHHATLLVNADLTTLKTLLKQSPRNMNAKGVRSQPSPVANLSSPQNRLDIHSVVRALSVEWGEPEGPAHLNPLEYSRSETFSSSLTRLESTEWIWEKTPQFSERFKELPGLNSREIEFTIQSGRISKAPEFAAFLVGVPYHGPDILQAARTYTHPPTWIETLSRKVDGDDLLAL